MNRHGDGLMKERARIVARLRNLQLYFKMGAGGGGLHIDISSKEREELICEFASLQEVIPKLPAEERQAISMVGLQGMTEREAASTLGISQQAVHKRLWSAAARIQKFWASRCKNGAHLM